MKKALSFIAICATSTLLSSPAWAQSSSATDTNAASTQATSTSPNTNPQSFSRASDLLSKNAQDAQGNKIGSIKDFAFNHQGQLLALIDVGSGKLAVVPWEAVNTSTTNQDNVTLNATQQQLKAGPAVTKDQWGSLNNPQFVQGCYTYYNLQAPTATGGASSPGGTSQGGTSQSSTNAPGQ